MPISGQHGRDVCRLRLSARRVIEAAMIVEPLRMSSEADRVEINDLERLEPNELMAGSYR